MQPPIVTKPLKAAKGSVAMMQPKHNALAMTTQAVQGQGLSAADTSTPTHKHAVMWIDGIGGFLLWDKPELVLGQAFADSHADVGITGDLSRRAAVIRRMGTDYLLQPLQATRVNGQTLDRPLLLRDGTVIELGNSVKLRFRKPNTLSGTARLEMASIHRWKPNVDAILLLADCCMVGPRAGSHVPCPDWRNEVLLVHKPGGSPAPEPIATGKYALPKKCKLTDRRCAANSPLLLKHRFAGKISRSASNKVAMTRSQQRPLAPATQPLKATRSTHERTAWQEMGTSGEVHHGPTDFHTKFTCHASVTQTNQNCFEATRLA